METPSAAAQSTAGSLAPAPAGSGGGTCLADMERTAIEQALVNARYNKSLAAKMVGLTRHQLYIRMRRHGIK